MHVETNITMDGGWSKRYGNVECIVDKLWMEDGVKDMEMWNACRNQHNYS